MTSRPLNLGHRGASGSAPENTLAAFALAREFGADGIELDVQFSQDQQLIIIHDDTLDRTTNGHGRADALTLAELKTLDAGRWFNTKFADERIPTLQETFELFKGTTFYLNVEIKSDGDTRLADAVVACVQRNDMSEQVILSSFDQAMLRRVRHLAPALRIGFLYSKPDALQTLDFAPAALHPHWKLIHAEFVQQAHTRGQQINLWTVNETDDLRRMVVLGVDAIITNYPERLRAVISEQ
jgi:glycerophosphoryl diester phosphodiesterase